MFCTNCGAPYVTASRFCPNCGAALMAVEKEILLPTPQNGRLPQPAATASVSPEVYPSAAAASPVKRGTLRVPIGILAILCIVGLILFALFPDTASTGGNGANSGPFRNERGSLSFDELSYSGPSELTVPETVDGIAVTQISQRCFADCDNLTTVILPDTIEMIGWRAFYNCDSLRGIALPEGTLYIAGEAFAECPELEAVSIPATVEDISAGAFDFCPSLKYVFFSGTVKQWNQVFGGSFGSEATVYCSDGECPLE